MTCGFLIYLLTFIYGAMVMRGCDGGKNQPRRRSDREFCKTISTDAGKNHWDRGRRINTVSSMGRFVFIPFMVAQAFIPHEIMMEVKNMQQANAMGGGTGCQGQ